MDEHNEALWRQFLEEGNWLQKRGKSIFHSIPHDPRCMMCYSPFEGFGGKLMKLIGRDQSREDPRFCKACFNFSYEHPGGAYVDMAVLFADIRGSTPLAEKLGDRKFQNLVDRFFSVAGKALLDHMALLGRLAGDEANGIFVPGIAGEHYARAALDCGTEILRKTGHGDPNGPWVPVGVGVHFGNAYVGMVGSSIGAYDFTTLGDDVNVGARLASAAGAGELLASPALCAQAGVDTAGMEKRRLTLKGKDQPMEVVVIPFDS